MKITRRQLRQLIDETMKLGYGSGERSEIYPESDPTDDEAGLRFMGDTAYSVDDYEGLESQGAHSGADPDSLSHEDVHTARSSEPGAFQQLFMTAVSNPNKVLPVIKHLAAKERKEPFDYLVGLGMSEVAASNLMAALSQWDQAKKGMNFS